MSSPLSILSEVEIEMVPKPPSEESAGLKRQNLYRGFFPNRFLAETYKIVDDPTVDHIISWNKEGSTFIVWRQAEFANQVLPKYFKHNNFTSFVRQIYSYGFRKIVPLQNVSSDFWEFFNESFRRGEKHLLGNIRLKARRDPPVTTASLTADTVQTYSTDEQVLSPNSAWGVEAPPAPPNRFLSANLIQTFSTDEQVLSANSSWGVEAPPAPLSLFLSANLIEENDKLRTENLMLKEEDGKMKVLCDGFKLLTCNYLSSQQTGKVASPIATTLELMPPVPVSDEVMDQTKKVAVSRLSGTGGSWKPS